jgi:hypothetical protein
VRCHVNNSDIEEILQGCGFVRRNSYMRFMANKNIEEAGEIYNLDNWFITAGDCDIDR